MEHQIKDNTWTRQCPVCKNIVIHKNKNKCKYGERDNKPCTKCNRSLVGKRNADIDICPICQESIVVGIGSKNNNTEAHAKSHSISIEELWNIKHNSSTPLCKCGCKKYVNLKDWRSGYNTFIVGHHSSIWTSYDKEKATEISEKRKAKLRGKKSWAKGLTKETDDRIKKRGDATSLGRKAAFDRGDITIWSKGLTRETDDRIKALSEQIKNDFKSGKRKAWHTNASANNDVRIQQKNNNLIRKYKTGELVPWNKGKTGMDDPRILKTWENRDPHREYANIRFSHTEIFKLLESNLKVTLIKIENYKNNKIPSLIVRCRDCNWSDKVALVYAQNDICPQCCQRGSKAQHKIADVIESLGVTVGRNVIGIIKPYELDVFVPAKLYAIEFNGLYWHNELAGKDQYYHQRKSDKCKQLGIKLFHIFEDEWNKKQNIITSMIVNSLSLTQNRIFARNCEIIELNPKQKKQFFDDNHIDGDVLSNKAWGLSDNHKNIVCAMSVRKPFHKKYNDSIEIARMCSKLNTVVPGGLSKLTSHIKKWAIVNGFKKILSYVDTRLGNPNWSLAGYELIGETPPRFWWTDGHKRFNRFKFKADKKNNLTEAEVANLAGVSKIYGCKNLIYEIKL